MHFLAHLLGCHALAPARGSRNSRSRNYNFDCRVLCSFSFHGTIIFILWGHHFHLMEVHFHLMVYTHKLCRFCHDALSRTPWMCRNSCN
jgi:hypothetical protein